MIFTQKKHKNLHNCRNFIACTTRLLSCQPNKATWYMRKQPETRPIWNKMYWCAGVQNTSSRHGSLQTGRIRYCYTYWGISRKGKRGWYPKGEYTHSDFSLQESGRYWPPFHCWEKFREDPDRSIHRLVRAGIASFDSPQAFWKRDQV